MKVLSRTRNDLILWVVIACAVLSSCSVLLLRDTSWRSPLASCLLLVLALVAEVMPVEVSRKRVVVVFSLPYVACLSLLAGASAAIIVNVGLCLVSAARRRRRTRVASGKTTAVWNASVSAICASAGATAAELWQSAASGGLANSIVYVLVFCSVYLAANFLLVTVHDIRFVKVHFSDNLFATLRIGILSFLFYALVGAALAASVHERAGIPILFSLIPIFALRVGLAVRAESDRLYYETITTLTLMLQRVHPYTHGHLIRVAAFAEEVALRLGFSYHHAHLVREASVMHDLGKIAVDETILDKPGRLTEDEMTHVKQHAEFGAAILSKVALFQPLVNWVKMHHERPDGTGYPNRLADVEIPLEAKIIAVADAFDAMTAWEPNSERRTYREPRTISEAIVELDRCSGTQFDPTVVQVFKEVLQGYE